MSIALIIALICLGASVFWAVANKDYKSPMLWGLWSALSLYVLDHVI